MSTSSVTLEAPVDTIGAMSLGIVYAYIRDDLVGTPGGIGMHQKSSGHSGKSDVTQEPLLGKG